MHSIDVTAARVALRRNMRDFSTLMDEASRELNRGRPIRALSALQAAADFAWQHHPGVYRSQTLDAIILQFCDDLPAGRNGQPSPIHPGVEILHVLTQAYSVGGHTRLVRRWIAADSTRRHSVVLINQQQVPCPADLAAAVAESGGSIISLGGSNILERARELRDLVDSRTCLVVLHTHPGDLVPTIALARSDTRVVLLNHADHIFWVGAATSTVVAEIRNTGKELTLRRRGILAARSCLLPIPLEEPSRAEPHSTLRSDLGIPETSVILLSIAAAHKFGEGGTFAELHRDILKRHPEVVMLIIGPTSEGPWADVERDLAGRFRALGVRDDIATFYEAADIYVDSSPMGSLTSVLDAGLHGLPVVSLSGSSYGSVMSCEDPGLPPRLIQFRSYDGYLGRLEELIASPSLRAGQGRALAASVRPEHLGAGWSQHLELLYRRVLEPGEARPHLPTAHQGGLAPGEPEFADLMTVSMQGRQVPLSSWRLERGPGVAYLARVRLAADAVSRGDLRAVRHVLPRWFREIVAAITRWAGR